MLAASMLAVPPSFIKPALVGFTQLTTEQRADVLQSTDDLSPEAGLWSGEGSRRAWREPTLTWGERANSVLASSIAELCGVWVTNSHISVLRKYGELGRGASSQV